MRRHVIALLLAFLLFGCAGAPPPAASSPEGVAPVDGLDVSRGLEPLALECPPLDAPRASLAEREQRAMARWEEAHGRVEAGRHDAALEALVEAYCLLDGHPRQPNALYAIAAFLEDLGRYRAAYEGFRRAAAEGADVFDGYQSYRIFYLRSVLRRAAERLEAGEAPFALCGAGDHPACAASETCLRDAVRFDDGFCPSTTQRDRDCPGICVPDRIVRDEDR